MTLKPLIPFLCVCTFAACDDEEDPLTPARLAGEFALADVPESVLTSGRPLAEGCTRSAEGSLSLTADRIYSLELTRSTECEGSLLEESAALDGYFRFTTGDSLAFGSDLSDPTVSAPILTGRALNRSTVAIRTPPSFGDPFGGAELRFQRAP